MPYGPFEDAGSMRLWMTEQARSTDPLFLVVVENERRRPAGMASFLNVSPEMRRLELGHIWLIPELHRTSANTETAHLMLSHAFDDLGYRRVEWKCDALNERSRRAALRLGFGFEGVFRQHMVVKGRNRDTAWYAMLDGDWPRVKRHQHAWLSGRESRSLRELLDPEGSA
jgi:RimJ/RimL family protein N-acetyltransferase